MSKKLNYEDGIAQLEEIVNTLEQGSISLEESFKAYKQGMELYKALKAILDEGDARIEELTRQSAQEEQNADA
ncbi:MAG: exodeoxyribonuclease VII small subunit [Clostridia bacterium]|nr:exodeoxyribonuclease VII small subunit [Clostridia bacterium]